MQRSFRNRLVVERADRISRIMGNGAKVAAAQAWCVLGGQAVSFSGEAVPLRRTPYAHTFARLGLISRATLSYAIWAPPYARSPTTAPDLRWGFTIYMLGSTFVAFQRVVFAMGRVERIISTDMGDFYHASACDVAAWNGTIESYLATGSC